MKKIAKKISILLSLLSFLAIPCLTLANSSPLNALGTVGSAAGYASANSTSISTIAGTVIAAVLGLLGVIFVVLIIYAGIIWMTAQGDESKVEKAQTILRNSIIGLIVVFSAYAIYAVVIRIFPATMTSPTSLLLQNNFFI